jgi:alkylhydroperoxidase family enzyme
MSRLSPLDPPYDDVTGPLLASMTPEGVEPIALFRTFAINPSMMSAMRGWGSYELGRSMSLSLRAREIVIDRTCARCRCEYEWGVHVAFFADRAGLDRAQVASLTHGSAADPCWPDPAEAALIRAVDRLHDHGDIDDGLWTVLSGHYSPAQLLDLLMLTGWYHAISYTANGARVPLEDWAPRFTDYLGT